LKAFIFFNGLTFVKIVPISKI